MGLPWAPLGPPSAPPRTLPGLAVNTVRHSQNTCSGALCSACSESICSVLAKHLFGVRQVPKHCSVFVLVCTVGPTCFVHCFDRGMSYNSNLMPFCQSLCCSPSDIVIIIDFMLLFLWPGDLSRKMRRQKLAPEAPKQRRAPEKLKMTSKQATQCLKYLRSLCFFFGLGTYLERCAALF